MKMIDPHCHFNIGSPFDYSESEIHKGNFEFIMNSHEKFGINTGAFSPFSSVCADGVDVIYDDSEYLFKPANTHEKMYEADYRTSWNSLTRRSYKKSKHGNIFTDTSGCASNLNNVIEYAVKGVGSEKIFFGTDTYSCVFLIARIQYADISEEDKENIFYNNAKTHFKKQFSKI